MIKTANASIHHSAVGCDRVAVDQVAVGSDDQASQTASLVLKVQALLLGVGFVVAIMLGSLAPSKGQINAAMAMPEWNDQVLSWDARVEAFAARVVTGFGVRHEVALEFSPWILEAASRQQLAPELLAGLVLTESSFRKNVTSPVGAIGPAQVRPDFWSQFCGTSDLADPEENIYCGAQILAHYLERCGAEACALVAYNIGPHSVKQQAGQRYVAKVARSRDTLEQVKFDPRRAPVALEIDETLDASPLTSQDSIAL